MGYKNLLVQLDTTRACQKRVAAALELAQRFDAHLVGLYVSPELSVPSFIEAQLGEEVRTMQLNLRRERAEEAIGSFEEAARKAGVTVESRRQAAFLDEIPDVIALHGRYSDLVILGQQDEDDEESLPSSLTEETLLSVGRPVLMVPYIGAPEGFGRQITLGWDGSREAARAASDALPFLKRADAVRVLCVNPKRGIGGHGEEPGADIALSLARHGVKAEAQHVVSREVEVADLMLSRAADQGTDLMVLGAYGHSRMRELIMGGVTHTLLRNMTVPLLMSH
ncbi:universal stress protein [Aquibaculum arenosum]|uniref:Universal stress protein n=1 Tax=Aquibaculum arenosum TaxID=3032591 RepID=A0ABT5YPR8_9PROT|nr:universal stress protein [Fodinicurvata sp. CAU 1616]MDF2096884.1 universal stress protein [Fodinicurvata sp. CAU 1616]